jgi:hypothetical protein
MIIMCSRWGSHKWVIEAAVLGVRDVIIIPTSFEKLIDSERLMESVKKVIG